ncbi:hypothetical protein BS78_07G164300 [Paspalum vaginatum]|nr:hypothetical protein BS78_07G164300 [Paspalum vaginatum]
MPLRPPASAWHAGSLRLCSFQLPCRSPEPAPPSISFLCLPATVEQATRTSCHLPLLSQQPTAPYHFPPFMHSLHSFLASVKEDQQCPQSVTRIADDASAIVGSAIDIHNAQKLLEQMPPRAGAH